MENLLIQIARKQRELFLSNFDMSTHEPIPFEKPKRGLFGHHKPTNREILYSELNALKYQTGNNTAYTLGTHWWQIPWDNVEAAMQTALYEVKRDGHWRFESNIRVFPGEDGVQYVVLCEEGAAQTYAQERINQYETVSDYSKEEREKIMARYDKSRYERNLAQALAFEYSGASVQSPLTEKIYNDVVEYYVSEGWVIDSCFRSSYEQTLYKDKYVEGISVYSTSRARTKGIFAVGCYKTDLSGCLRGFKSFDYYPVYIAPENLKHVLLSRRIPGTAVFKLCEFISTDKNVQKIPFSLINNITDAADDKLNLLGLKSALLTLLSDKLIASKKADNL